MRSLITIDLFCQGVLIASLKMYSKSFLENANIGDKNQQNEQ